VAGAFVDVAIPGNIQRFSSGKNIGKNFGLFGTLANTGEALSGAISGVLTLFFSTAASITLIGLSVTAMALLGRKKLSAMVRHQKRPAESLSRKNQPNS
jgi:DHA3 family macrolide efflux protein-like MFS transporter